MTAARKKINIPRIGAYLIIEIMIVTPVHFAVNDCPYPNPAAGGEVPCIVPFTGEGIPYVHPSVNKMNRAICTVIYNIVRQPPNFV